MRPMPVLPEPPSPSPDAPGLPIQWLPEPEPSPIRRS